MQGLYQNKRQGKVVPPKLDNFWKHSGRRKALATIPRVCKANEYYMNKDFGPCLK
jgi:hypothetical protein